MSSSLSVHEAARATVAAEPTHASIALSHNAAAHSPSMPEPPAANRPATVAARRSIRQRLSASFWALFGASPAHGAQPPTAPLTAQALARFGELAESVHDVFWVYEPQSRCFLYVSPAYQQEWQLNAAALYTDASQWLSPVHRDDRIFVQEAFDALASGEGYAVEYRATLRSGEERWISERAFPVAKRRGEVLHIAGVSQDITARKLAEQVISQASRRKEEFMAMLAHELRGPLQPIRAAAAVLARLHVDGSVMERGATKIIERQINQLTQIVDDLLDFSCIAHGKVRLRLGTVRIEEALGVAIEANRALADKGQVSFCVKLPHHDATLTGDSTRLIQVFSNLLHNAVKFSPPGSTIWISASSDAATGDVKVSVRDEGAGIQADRIDSIFDLFTQGQGDAVQDHGGMGIGLAVVRSLTALHGGTVSVQSGGEGQGSEFVVTLPATGVTADAVRHEPQ